MYGSLDGMLVQHRAIHNFPSFIFLGGGGGVRTGSVKFFTREHKTMASVGASTRTTQSGVQPHSQWGHQTWQTLDNLAIFFFSFRVLSISNFSSPCHVNVIQVDRSSFLFICVYRQGLKACAVLFPLLGMTWVFGILTVTDAGLVFQYIFTILNSLQVTRLLSSVLLLVIN